MKLKPINRLFSPILCALVYLVIYSGCTSSRKLGIVGPPTTPPPKCPLGSTDPTCTTNIDLPPEIVGLINKTNITTTSVRISWTTNELADGMIQYDSDISDGFYNTITPTLAPNTSQSFDLVGLIPNTLYHFKVVATDPGGHQTISGDQTFQTLGVPALPVVSIMSATQNVNENGNTASIVVSVANPGANSVTVQYSVGGTASQPGDHTLTNGVLTIPQGQTSGSINFSVINDTRDEPDQSIVVTLTSPTNATLGTTTVHTATIIDDDLNPTVYFLSSGTSVNETGSPSVNATVVLDAASEFVVTVPYTTNTGTSSYPSDHNLNSSGGTVTFNPQETSKNIPFSIVDDSLDESNETVKLVLGTATNATTGSTTAQPNTTTFTINDDDPLPVISIPTSSQTVGEAHGQVTIPLNLNQVSGRDVTVSYTVSGTALNPEDHNLASGTVLFTAGLTSANIVFNVVNDSEPPNESTETVRVDLTSPINATVDMSFDDHTVTISDASNLPSVSFSIAQSVPEGVGSVTVTATLSSAFNADVLVPYVVSGTASNPQDHNLANNGTITIPANSLSASATFSVVDDSLDETNETVIVTMQALTNATPGAITEHTVTITDNDSPPSFSFSSNAQSGSENTGSKIITVNLSAASGLDTSVNYSISGTANNPADHTLSDGTLSISAGNTSKSITLPVINDTLDEDDETVIITLSDPTNAGLGSTTTHTVTILDNDASPTVSLSLATQSVDEGVGAAVVTVNLSTVSGRNVSVPFTVGGTSSKPGDSNPDDDHDLVAGNFTINNGSTSASIIISISNDTLDEANETIIVTLSTPTNASLGSIASQTITITDNDAPPIVQFSTSSQSMAEDSGTVTVSATLTAASGLVVTVDFGVSGTSTNPADHNLSANTLTFAAGVTTKSLTFDIVNDTLDEDDDETVILTLSNAVNASLGTLNPQTVKITDNDAPPTVNFSATSQNAYENAGSVTVTVNSSAVSGRNIIIPLTRSGSATNPSDHDLGTNPSITILAGSTSQSLTFNLANDTVIESDETAILTMGTPTNGTAGTINVHTVTIKDEDADVTPPVVSNEKVIDLRSRRITAEWDTDEPADSKVTCSASGVPTVVVTNSALVLTHSIRVQVLNELINYSCTIVSKDPSGNESISKTVTATTLSNVFGFIFNLYLEVMNRTPAADIKSINLTTGVETLVSNGLPDEIEHHVFKYNEYYGTLTTGTVAQREKNARADRALTFARSGEFKMLYTNEIYNLTLRRNNTDPNNPPPGPEFNNNPADAWVLERLQHWEKIEDLNLNGVLDTNPFGNNVSEDRNSNGILNFTRFDPYGATSLRVDTFATKAGEWDLDTVIPGLLSSNEYRIDSGASDPIPHKSLCRVESSTENVTINNVQYPKIIGGIVHDIYMITRGNDADQSGIRFWSDPAACDPNDATKIPNSGSQVSDLANKLFTDLGSSATGTTPARDFWISKTASDFWKRVPTTSEINTLGDGCTRKTTGCRYLMDLYPSIISDLIFYNLP